MEGKFLKYIGGALILFMIINLIVSINNIPKDSYKKLLRQYKMQQTTIEMIEKDIVDNARWLRRNTDEIEFLYDYLEHKSK